MSSERMKNAWNFYFSLVISLKIPPLPRNACARVFYGLWVMFFLFCFPIHSFHGLWSRLAETFFVENHSLFLLLTDYMRIFSYFKKGQKVSTQKIIILIMRLETSNSLVYHHESKEILIISFPILSNHYFILLTKGFFFNFYEDWMSLTGSFFRLIDFYSIERIYLIFTMFCLHALKFFNFSMEFRVHFSSSCLVCNSHCNSQRRKRT